MLHSPLILQAISSLRDNLTTLKSRLPLQQDIELLHV